jgi:hypothetical protein
MLRANNYRLVSITFRQPIMIANLSTLGIPESMTFNIYSIEGAKQTKLQF